MKHFLIRLYPAGWRARYAEEFEAILDERPLGPFDVADIVLSAIDAHLRPRGSAAAGDHTRGVLMTLRTAGVAAIVGGTLWLISLVGASTIQGPDGQPWLVLFLFATVALLVAMVGLSGIQGRRQPGLVWAALVIPIIGGAISMIGVLGMASTGDGPFLFGASAWELWILGTLGLIIGSGLFAVSSLLNGGSSRAGAVLLVVGALAAVPLFFGIASPIGPTEVGNIVALLGIFAFASGWVWSGISALRVGGAVPPGSPGAALP